MSEDHMDDVIKPRIPLHEAKSLIDVIHRIVVNNLFHEVLTEYEVNSLRIWEVKMSDLLARAITRQTLRDLQS